MATDEELKTFKGTDLNLQCRGFQFEVGKTYEHDGKVKACSGGFHACEYPLDVFGYYPPGESRYFTVKQGGQIARHADDTKIASGRITFEAEIKLPDFIAAAVKWVIAQTTPAESNHADGYQSAASSTGYRSAASSTGYQSAASSTGYRSAAMSAGREGRVMAAEGCALFLVYRDPDTYDIKRAWAGIAGRDGIKPLVWYSLDADGKPFEVAQ